jgi:DNA-binding Lrp family transcriptional regulator
MTAYVLVRTRSEGRPVAAALRTMRGVVMAHDLTGPYDAIALVDAESSGDLFSRVLPEIKELPGVTQALPAPLGRFFARRQQPVPAGEAA